MTLFDWARREQEEMKTPAYARAKEYFHALFAEAEVTRLAAAGAQVGGEEIVEKVSLRMDEVDEWCARHRVSAYHFLMAAFCLTLSKLSHQKKVVFCTLNHGRYDKKLAEAYGMFVNTVPFIAEINPRATIDEFMAQVRKRLVDHYRHRSYPFTHFCSDTGLVPTITFGFQSNGILEQTIIEGKRYEGAQLLRPDSRSDLSVLEALQLRIEHAVFDRHAEARHRLDLLEHRLDAVDPQRALDRGFLIALKDGRRAATAAAFTPGDRLSVMFRDGIVDAEVSKIRRK